MIPQICYQCGELEEDLREWQNVFCSSLKIIQVRECILGKKKKMEKKLKKAETTGIEGYLKRLPPPPEEHTYELKMEKRLKRMLEELEKKQPSQPK